MFGAESDVGFLCAVTSINTMGRGVCAIGMPQLRPEEQNLRSAAAPSRRREDCYSIGHWPPILQWQRAIAIQKSLIACRSSWLWVGQSFQVSITLQNHLP
jgi:hypothetical protein